MTNIKKETLSLSLDTKLTFKCFLKNFYLFIFLLESGVTKTNKYNCLYTLLQLLSPIRMNVYLQFNDIPKSRNYHDSILMLKHEIIFFIRTNMRLLNNLKL